MYDTVEYVYQHDHTCQHGGEIMTTRPVCSAGSALRIPPICIELDVELTLIETRKN
jgi:hypothetical protein